MADGGGGILDVVLRRSDVLAALDTTWTGKPDLQRALDVSRSTVDRACRELEYWGLVERDGSRFRQSAAGVVAHEEVERFTTRLQGIERVADMLGPLEPEVDPPLDGVLFDDAIVVAPDRRSPRRPVDEQTTIVERSSEVRTLGARVLPQLVETYHRRIVEDGMRASIVLHDAIIERLVASYRKELGECLATGRLDLRRSEHRPTYSLALGETADGPAVGLLFYGESETRGFLGTDHPAAVCWARRRFEERWQEAHEIGSLTSME